MEVSMNWSMLKGKFKELTLVGRGRRLGYGRGIHRAEGGAAAAGQPSDRRQSQLRCLNPTLACPSAGAPRGMLRYDSRQGVSVAAGEGPGGAESAVPPQQLVPPTAGVTKLELLQPDSAGCICAAELLAYRRPGRRAPVRVCVAHRPAPHTAGLQELPIADRVQETVAALIEEPENVRRSLGLYSLGGER